MVANEKERMNANIKVLGIRIDNLTHNEIENWVKNVLVNPPEQKFVITLNPEIILEGYRNEDYGKILNGADLNLCDGFGIKFASFFKGKKIKERYTGVDLADYLLGLAKEKNRNVLVVAGEDSLSGPEEIRRGIEDKYNFSVRSGYIDGIFSDADAAGNAEIVFVNFGAPEQEKFIFENREKFPKAKVLVGVGGTFDFLTGKMKRAPKLMRKAGLEWLFRLVQEPKRLKRMIDATIIFPFLAIFNSE